MLSALKDFLVEIIGSTGYIGIFITMFLSSCLIPIPSEIVMPVAGMLAVEGRLDLILVVVVGTIANLTGSLLAYFVGIRVKEESILAWVRRWGKFILISEHEYSKAAHWIKHYGKAVSFFSRLVPGVRTVISLPAGVARIKLIPFVVYSVLGSLLWNVILTVLGYKFGENWEVIEPYMKRFELVIIVAGLLLVGLYVAKKLGVGFSKKS